MATKYTAVTKKDDLIYAKPTLKDTLVRAAIQPSGQRNTPYAGTDPTTGRATNQPGGISKVIDKTEKDQYSKIRDASGNLTDYGKSLERQSVNYAGMDTQGGYVANAGSNYGGITPTYEAYAGNAQARGQAFMDRDTWERMMGESGKSYVSGTGGGTVVTGGTTGTTGAIGNIAQSRQQAVDALREKLGIQKASATASVLSTAEKAKQDISAAYQRSKAGELESLVNQGLATGTAGAEQSGLARSQILQSQLAAENQQNAVTTQSAADVNALETQYNALIAQGEADKAQALIDDAYKKYEYDTQAKQYADTLAEQQRQREATAKANADAIAYEREQAALKAEQQASDTEYERAKYDEEFAYKQWYDLQNLNIKTAAQKLAVQKAKQAYETAKARTAIAQQNANKKRTGSTKKTGTSGTKDSSGLSIFG